MRVFVSYASEDAESARRIHAVLLQEGHTVFLDQEELAVGSGFHKRIRDEIGACDLLVFLVSPGSVQSNRYAMLELETAQARWPDATGRVLPVLLGGVTPSLLPAYLGTVGAGEPTGDLGGWVAMQIDRMARARASSGQALLQRFAARPWQAAATLAALCLPVVLSGFAGVDPPWPAGNLTHVFAAVVAIAVGVLVAWVLSRRVTRTTLTVVSVGCLLGALVSLIFFLAQRGEHVTDSAIQPFVTLPSTAETLKPEVYEQLHAFVGPDEAYPTLSEAVDDFRARPGNHDASKIWKAGAVQSLRMTLFGSWLLAQLLWACALGCLFLRPRRILA